MEKRHKFLNDVIHSGFDTLRASRIRYAVKKEEQKDSVNAWILILINDCNWNEESDLQRISEAFKFIARNDKDFPSIARFLEVLRAREPIPSHLWVPYIPPAPTAEEIKNRNAAKQMLKNLLKQFKIGEKHDNN